MKVTEIICPQPYYAPENSSIIEPVFFAFEADFVEDNVRCIPMIVRFKLDASGIKLKLSEWSRLTIEERNLLAALPCSAKKEVLCYRNYLRQLVFKRTGTAATGLVIDINPDWANENKLPEMLVGKLQECRWFISLRQWACLTSLQRFVLVKLCRPGHENKNFPKAMKEFGLV